MLVLIFISVLFVDSLVPTVVWTLLWSVYVYGSNLWSSASTNLPASSINVRNVAAQQERRARAGSGLVPTRLPQDVGGNIYDVPEYN